MRFDYPYRDTKGAVRPELEGPDPEVQADALKQNNCEWYKMPSDAMKVTGIFSENVPYSPALSISAITLEKLRSKTVVSTINKSQLQRELRFGY